MYGERGWGVGVAGSTVNLVMRVGSFGSGRKASVLIVAPTVCAAMRIFWNKAPCATSEALWPQLYRELSRCSMLKTDTVFPLTTNFQGWQFSPEGAYVPAVIIFSISSLI